MSSYNNEYYIVHNLEGDDHIFLNATKNTAARKYSYMKNDRISEPFFFYNDNKQSSIKSSEIDIMLDGVDLVISDSARKALKSEAVTGLQFNTAVYIDENDVWNEDFWYLTFFEKLYCLDTLKSEALRGDLVSYGKESSMTINKYSLDASKLDMIPLENRLLFKMGGTSFSYIFIHESIFEKISINEFKGARFFKVSNFEEGDQYY